MQTMDARVSMRSALIVFGLAVLHAGCTTAPASSPIEGLSAARTVGSDKDLSARAPIHLTILHTNDHHGRFWANADGEGGLAARQTLIDSVRSEVAAAGGYTLLLDGGDVNTGVPESDLQNAEPDFKGMDRLRYDAMAVGNHEFDKPPSVLAKQRTWIGFPMLSANIYRGGERMFEPYRIFQRGAYRIAVIGLTTDDTQKMVLPDHITGVHFRKPIEEASELLPVVRPQADMVIATTHMGHYPDGKRGVNAPGDVEMARAVNGFDLIVGGHSQNPVCMLAENQRHEAYVPGTPCAPDRQNGTWIVQAHEWGKYVGRADFKVESGRVELLHYQLLPVNQKKREPDGKKTLATPPIAEDAAMLALLTPFQQIGAGRLSEPVAVSDAVLDGDRVRVRQQPTNLGYLIARAMMERTGADLALINSGGVRDSLPAGPISYRDVLKVQPFSNTVGVVTLSGAELMDYLRAAARMTPGAGGFPQTAGVQMQIQGAEVHEVRIGGQPFNLGRTYRLAINNFTALGGDGYPRLHGHPGYVDSGFNDADVLRAYLAAHSPIKTTEYETGDAVTRR